MPVLPVKCWVLIIASFGHCGAGRNPGGKAGVVKWAPRWLVVPVVIPAVRAWIIWGSGNAAQRIHALNNEYLLPPFQIWRAIDVARAYLEARPQPEIAQEPDYEATLAALS